MHFLFLAERESRQSPWRSIGMRKGLKRKKRDPPPPHRVCQEETGPGRSFTRHKGKIHPDQSEAAVKGSKIDPHSSWTNGVYSIPDAESSFFEREVSEEVDVSRSSSSFSCSRKRENEILIPKAFLIYL